MPTSIIDLTKFNGMGLIAKSFKFKDLIANLLFKEDFANSWQIQGQTCHNPIKEYMEVWLGIQIVQE